MEEEIKAKKEDYLKLFDEIFKANTKNNIDLEKVPLISMIYDKFIHELMTMSYDFKNKKLKSAEIYKKIEKNLTKGQQDLINKYIEIETELNSELGEKMFIFGYIFAKQLELETENSNIK